MLNFYTLKRKKAGKNVQNVKQLYKRLMDATILIAHAPLNFAIFVKDNGESATYVAECSKREKLKKFKIKQMLTLDLEDID